MINDTHLNNGNKQTLQSSRSSYHWLNNISNSSIYTTHPSSDYDRNSSLSEATESRRPAGANAPCKIACTSVNQQRSPAMGSTSTKHRQIAPGSMLLHGSEQEHHAITSRRPTVPQLEVHGQRLTPKAKSITVSAIQYLHGPENGNTLMESRESPSGSRVHVSKKTTPIHRARNHVASTKVKCKDSKLGSRSCAHQRLNNRHNSADNIVMSSPLRAEINGRLPLHRMNSNPKAAYRISPNHHIVNGRSTMLSNKKSSSLDRINQHNVAITSGSRASRQSHQVSQPYGKQTESLAVNKLPKYNTPEACIATTKRLKYILQLLKRDEIPREDLIKNIQYVSKVIGAAYKRESSRLCNEEDELSEVTESDVVPGQVKDWLTSTFTRSLTGFRRRGADRLHFRSVANAIRAGIVVDRLYRRMSSSAGMHVPPNVLLVLKHLDDWNFNVFQVNEIGEGHALKYLGFELLQKYQLINKFKINTQNLDSFLIRMEQGYSKHGNPYHNLVHAADVAQTTHSILTESGLSMWLSDLEIFAILIAALIHDYEHTGTTNAFHINTSSEVALLYNDKNVLENHHISAAFRVMREDNHNILQTLKKDEYKEFRSLVIEIVLSTDMSLHFQQLKNMKGFLALPEPIDKAKALSLIVHCADISHPAKPWTLHQRWTEHLVEEFFKQGDQETALGLAISPLCDRKNTLIAQSQIGFIDFIVDPSFQVMGDMLERIMTAINEQKMEQAPVGDADSQQDVIRVRRDSLSSSTSSIHTSPKPEKGGPPVLLHRAWVDFFIDNKLHWREKAVQETEAAKNASTENAPPSGKDESDHPGDTTSREKTEGSPTRDAATTVTSHPASPTDEIEVEPQDNLVPPSGEAGGNDMEYETDITESELDLSASSSNSSIHDELRKLDDAEIESNDKIPDG